MSTMEAEANVESITRTPDRRFGLNPLQQFARAGLDLKIGDFRQMCRELHDCGIVGEPNGIADILFDWMTATLESET